MRARPGRGITPILAAVALAALAAAAPAPASTWCGENGVVRLSFHEGPELQPVATVAPGEGGVTVVDLWAYLDEVEPMQRDGERFLGIGGFELKLVIDGAAGTIVKQEFPFPATAIGREPGSCIVGINPTARLEGGRTQLVHWQVQFPQPPARVTFCLDPAGMPTCASLEGCPESGVHAIYCGTVDARQVGDLFGAGYAPAYLNWPQAPAVEAVRGRTTWREVGVYEAAAAAVSPNTPR